MNIQEALLTPNKYSRRQKPNVVKKIVMHYVGNPKSSVMGNRNYFESLKTGVMQANGTYRFASSHYVIGMVGDILRCIPENEEAIHASSSELNVSSIGIENCHPDATGKFTDATYNSAVELCSDICERYKLNPLVDIIRHYDVNQKICPKWFVDHPADWEKFKQDVKAKMDSHVKPPVDIEITQIISGMLNTKNKKGNAITQDPATWTKVLKGETPCNPEWLKVILKRFLNLD